MPSSRVLILSVFFVFHCDVSYAGPQPVTETETVKCGRDCVFTAARLLRGKDSPSLDEIDALLGYKFEHSFFDLRQVLEKFGFFCNSVEVTSDELGRLGSTGRIDFSETVGIVHLPGEGTNVGHFLMILTADDQQITFFDPSKRGLFSSSHEELKVQQFRILFVGNTPSVTGITVWQWRILWHSLLRTFASIGVSILLCTIVVFLIVRTRKERSCSRLPYWVHACKGMARRLRQRWLWMAGVAIGLIVLTITSVTSLHQRHSGLNVEQALFDIGRVPVGSEKIIEVALLNDGVEPIDVEVSASCSCLKLDVPKEPIKPGERFVFRATYVVSKVGALQNLLYVKPRGNTDKELSHTIEIRGAGVESARLTPATFQLGPLPNTGAIDRVVEFQVENFFGAPVALDSVESVDENPPLNLQLMDNATLSTGGKVRIRFHSVANHSNGVFTQRCVVRSLRGATFVLSAHGEFADAVFACPTSLYVSAESLRETGTSPTVAISSLGSPLEVTSTDCEPNVFRIVRDDTVSDNRRIVFRILHADIDEADYRKPIILRFVVNHSQRIEVPIYTSFMLPVNEEQHNKRAAGLPE